VSLKAFIINSHCKTVSQVLNYTSVKNEIEIFQGPEGDLNVELCLKTVEKFVMKPQREGGGKFQVFNLSTQY